MENLLEANTFKQLQDPELQHWVSANLQEFGWTLLRGFDVNLESFGTLLTGYCDTLTFDPARAFVDGMSQKVDAGTDAVGLHIENGNTPFPPKLVGFYSAKSAKEGSQTTVCDGVELLDSLPERLKSQWQQQVTVSRHLPSALWRQYIVDNHPGVSHPEQVAQQHLDELMAINPCQRGTVDEDDALDYELDIQPCLPTTLGNSKTSLAFANAILGPSFNYQKPVYRFASGELLSDELLQETEHYAEKCTREVAWQDGDIVLINNHRVMHGRREISGSLEDRQLFIGMGS